MYVYTEALYNEQDVTQYQFLSGVKLVWIQSFPSLWLVLLPKLKKPSLTYYLSIAGERTDGFMPFLRAFVWSET